MRGKRRIRTGNHPARSAKPEAQLRVVGGELRGRSFRYNGDPGLRPMKDRVREAVFNLIGPAVKGRRVVDLFAGTGAMSFEAVSRGATSAVLVERKFPNVRLIKENAAGLGIDERLDVRAGDTFLVYHDLPLGDAPWLVFCCPPYDFYVSRIEEVSRLVQWFCDAAPPSSLIVVEADQRFDTSQLPDEDAWDIRQYPPAVVCVFEKLPAVETEGKRSGRAQH